jgi:hypothetical protein
MYVENHEINGETSDGYQGMGAVDACDLNANC